MKKTYIALLIASLFLSQPLFAKSKAEIKEKVKASIETFKKDVEGGKDFLPQVEGYLVMPSIVKGGMFIAVEYGEGALIVDNKIKAYYSLTSGSMGMQFGAKEYDLIIAFVSKASLKEFMSGDGWEADADSSIVLSDWKKQEDISTVTHDKPIIAFMYNTKGAMAGISISGKKFERIK